MISELQSSSPLGREPCLPCSLASVAAERRSALGAMHRRLATWPSACAPKRQRALSHTKSLMSTLACSSRTVQWSLAALALPGNSRQLQAPSELCVRRAQMVEELQTICEGNNLVPRWRCRRHGCGFRWKPILLNVPRVSCSFGERQGSGAGKYRSTARRELRVAR